jgi:hypothetical protein
MMGRIGAFIFFLLLPLPAAHADLERVLVVHDAGSRPEPGEGRAIAFLCSLLGHFDSAVSVLPASDYQMGEVNGHDAMVYLGLRADAEVPDVLVGDCYDTSKPVCWLGEGLGQLASRFSLGRYGFRLDEASAEDPPRRITYQGRTHWRGAAVLPSIAITSPDVCAVVATVEAESGARPYAVRSGSFHYFVEVPFPPSQANDTYIVFSDYLHEFLGARHALERRALIAVGPVTPDTDPTALAALMRLLRSGDVAPSIFVKPLTSTAKGGSPRSLSQRRSVVSVLRGAQREGASIIASSGPPGSALATPQAGTPTGLRESVGDSGSPARLLGQMESELDALASCGLYPLAWELSRDFLGDVRLPELAAVASTMWVTCGGAPSEQQRYALPFVIASDQGGQRVLPDNVGRLAEGRGEVEAIISAANRLATVPDPWITVGVMPEAPLDAVGLLVRGLRTSRYQSVDLREMMCSVSGEALRVHSVSNSTPLEELMPQAWHAILLGPDVGQRRRFESPERDRRGETLVHPGSILAAYPPNSKPMTVFSWEGDPEQLTSRLLQGTARIIVLFAASASVVLLLIYFAQIALRRRA